MYFFGQVHRANALKRLDMLSWYYHDLLAEPRGRSPLHDAVR